MHALTRRPTSDEDVIAQLRTALERAEARRCEADREHRDALAEMEARFTESAAREEDLCARWSAARADHRSDIAEIGAALLEEADAEWFEDFDEFVARLNHSLSVKLPLRKRSYIVTVDATVEIQVEATGEEDARRQAYEVAREAEHAVDDIGGVHNSTWDSMVEYVAEEQ